MANSGTSDPAWQSFGTFAAIAPSPEGAPESPWSEPMPKYRLLTPGPVAVPERVRLAMAQTLLHHRAPDFLPVFAEVRENLKKVYQTERDVLILTSSVTDKMVQISSLGGGVSTLAEQVASSNTQLAVIETGGALSGGGNAAGRRVQLPWGRSNLDINGLTADGMNLMDRSIEWAAGAISGGRLR